MANTNTTDEYVDAFCLTCGMSPKVVKQDPAAVGEECWGPKDGFCGDDAVTFAKDNNGQEHPYCAEHAADIEHMHYDGAHSSNWIASGDNPPEWAR
jgi:hypothetical protein